MGQEQHNMLFRWFVDLSMDDTVWVPTVFTKNRDRLADHDAIIAFFNEVVTMAAEKGWLSGEHFSVDSTLLGAWAGHKGFVRKAKDDYDDDDDGSGSGSGDGGGRGDFKGQTRSNETHESKTDPDARLYRKG